VIRVGTFLVATPQIDTGVFCHSVVFIYENTAQGTVGLNLSRPTDYALSHIQPHKIVDHITEDPVIYCGGPVNQSAVTMLHTEDFVSVNTLITHTGLNVSSDVAMIDRLCAGDRPVQFRLTAGASVWTVGQLQREISQNMWLTAQLDHTLVFDLSGHDLWYWAFAQAAQQTLERYF
jgi:putative transcriptional regulator